MIGSDIHEDSDVGAKLIHVVQLEGTQFYDIIIMLFHGYLQGKAVADVSCQSHVQSRTLEDMINERSGGSLTVGAGDTNHLGVCITSGKLYFGDDRNAFFF